MFCIIKQKHFTDYKYEAVIWSGDSLPVCPHCRKSLYESNFAKTHSQDENKSEDKYETT